MNWRAAATLLIVVPVHVPGLAHTRSTRGSTSGSGYANFSKASWLMSVAMAAVVYGMLRLVWAPDSTLVTSPTMWMYICRSRVSRGHRRRK